MMKRKIRGILILVALASGGSSLLAQSTATQTLTLEVKPVSKITVSGNPGSLLITDFSAGLPSTSVADNSTRYDITTNLASTKIVASINNQMPTGTKLYLKLESGKGSTTGLVDISNALSPVDVVQGIPKGTDASQAITYVFAADAAAGEVVPQSRTIVLTLTE